MGLTSAMYTGLSGMNVNQTRIDTIGNNIANVNTTAFKSSRTLFQAQLSRLLSAGNGPSATSGGVNPTQIGLGAVVGATQRDMTAGSIETTGLNSDAAIQGNGMFIVQRPNGQQMYTRDGSFSRDPSSSRLITSDGYLVRGFGIDSNFNVVPGVLTDISIPLGSLTLARATQNVTMDGELSAGGTVATQGNTTASQALVGGGGGAAVAGTALTDLRSASVPGTTLFAAGDSITVSGMTRGGSVLPDRTFVVGTDGNTLGDFASWLQSTALIDTSAGVPGTPGVTVENGQLVIRSNAGESNAITLNANTVRNTTGSSLPFSFTETAAATGSGVASSFTVYDSLGNAVNVSATYALDSLAATGPVWRYYLTAPNGAGVPQSIGTGTVTFDNNGNFVSAAGNQFNLDRTGTGATSPQQVTLDFASVNGLSTVNSEIVSTQDGYPTGTLIDFGIGQDGTINGTFSNGLNRPLGQIALASFANPLGLVADSDNLYGEGPNSGSPIITTPGAGSAGLLLGGALELSNVDLSREFIGLITSSAAFQASSRVISTSSDMLDQLLLIAR